MWRAANPLIRDNEGRLAWARLGRTYAKRGIVLDLAVMTGLWVLDRVRAGLAAAAGGQ
jgi:hypothetical protein